MDIQLSNNLVQIRKKQVARPNLLQDRIILITGAGDGIGKAAAVSCAALGAKVILAGRTLAKLEQVLPALRSPLGIAAFVPLYALWVTLLLPGVWASIKAVLHGMRSP
mgnify:CR=1 FL=1